MHQWLVQPFGLGYTLGDTEGLLDDLVQRPSSVQSPTGNAESGVKESAAGDSGDAGSTDDHQGPGESESEQKPVAAVTARGQGAGGTSGGESSTTAQAPAKLGFANGKELDELVDARYAMVSKFDRTMLETGIENLTGGMGDVDAPGLAKIMGLLEFPMTDAEASEWLGFTRCSPLAEQSSDKTVVDQFQQLLSVAG